ncbi:MAG: AmmeMemoRadiSam system protein B [Candidatus Pacebacteria bacterium]|nr:AmmeMemoRadiSam system protein B [Candidatus Paceibacterota bacterium]
MEKSLKNILILCLILSGAVLGFLLQGRMQKISTVQYAGCSKGIHQSYLSDKDFFDNAYAGVVKKYDMPEKKDLLGVFVNHHLLAPAIIADTMNAVASDAPIDILLVSPNHFSAGNGQIISSIDNWDTPYGNLNPDCDTIRLLEKSGTVSIEEAPFEREHGVSGIVPFIKKSFPNARIIPIIVKDTASDKVIDEAVENIRKALPEGTMLVGSFDFSHYLPDTVAQFHDEKMLAVINNFDFDGLKMTDADSLPGLRLYLKYMEAEGGHAFGILHHTNSAEVTKNPDLEETTSYIDGFFERRESAQDKRVTVLAFGDLMLDRQVRNLIAVNGSEYPFANIKRFLKGSDIVVANAEGTFTNFSSVTADLHNKELHFTFDEAMLPVLKKLGFTTLSQANNHALDFGKVGLTESQKAITQAGLETFGDPLNSQSEPIIETVRGQKIAFVGYHEFGPQNDDAILGAIGKAKAQGAFTIVYPHWGVEYQKNPTSLQVELAHRFIDAGADLILGSHPHVVEPIEVYKGKAIFYSLGNFVFDQDFSKETMRGLSVGVSVDDQAVSYYLFPLDIRRGQVSLSHISDSDTILKKLAEDSSAETSVKKGIEKGIFTLSR